MKKPTHKEISNKLRQAREAGALVLPVKFILNLP
jgi:hypothetical protein